MGFRSSFYSYGKVGLRSTDSQGGKNVMTLATEKTAGQAMTWDGVSNGLGLVGAAGL